MEVKLGYKQTEVGVIPEDWRVQPLGELGEALIGLTYKPSDVREHGTLVLRSSNIQNDALAFEDNVFVDAEVPDRIMVRLGDVLVCVRNGSRNLIGKTALLDERAMGMTFGAFMAVYRSPIGKLASYLFQSEIVKRQINEHLGATINQITNKSLNSFRIPVSPDDVERDAIAAALSDVDALLGGLDRLIAKKRDLKQAAMQQLLTGQTRLPGFSGAWQVKRVLELGDVVTGGTPRTDVAEFWGDEYPWVTPTDISTRRDMFSSDRWLTKKGLDAVRVLPPNTVLVTCIASIGKNAVLRTTGACNQQINAVIPNRSSDAGFLYYLFEASKQYLLANAGITATSIISKAAFSELTFRTPLLEEQVAIAAVLSDMDAELAALEARRDKTRDLKQAMMQELLTGKTRLVKPEAGHA